MSWRVHAWLTWGLLLVICGLVTLVLLEPVPLVSRTWPDGQCVAVVPAPWTCEQLPARYAVQWVAPEEGP